MAASRICTRSSLGRYDDVPMDVIAILIAVAMFAVLLAMVYGIERI
jgi:hypothetical protein